MSDGNHNSGGAFNTMVNPYIKRDLPQIYITIYLSNGKRYFTRGFSWHETFDKDNIFNKFKEMDINLLENRYFTNSYRSVVYIPIIKNKKLLLVIDFGNPSNPLRDSALLSKKNKKLIKGILENDNKNILPKNVFIENDVKIKNLILLFGNPVIIGKKYIYIYNEKNNGCYKIKNDEKTYLLTFINDEYFIYGTRIYCQEKIDLPYFKNIDFNKVINEIDSFKDIPYILIQGKKHKFRYDLSENYYQVLLLFTNREIKNRGQFEIKGIIVREQNYYFCARSDGKIIQIIVCSEEDYLTVIKCLKITKIIY